ncbi:MAG TPA: hypothetical protein VNV66_21835 [Pilimelia sp.]|nr:hypothetical protein [Pilimelia sp.]
MRLTVGPLPAAVYWRRRAIVLGVLLVALITLYSACGGSSDAGRSPGAATPTPDTASPEPTRSLLTPESGGPSPAATEEPDPGPTATASVAAPPPAPPPAPTGACTDAEIVITPVPAKTSVRAGTPMDLRLKIQNSSPRTCSRDVGAEYQELRLVRGAETTWSSDHCGSSRASDVRSFAPGGVREYMVTWNGRSSSKCANGQAAAPVAAGEYQLIGRLGTKYSQPVRITVTR